MGKKRKKKASALSAGFLRMLQTALILLILLAVLPLAVLGMRRAILQFDQQSFLKESLTNAERDALACEVVFTQQEEKLRNWAYALRESGCTESADILRGTAQGCQMLGAKHLYLIDDDGYYYGSNGSLIQTTLYQSTLEQLSGEFLTLGRPNGISIFLQIRPFTVDGSTFRWVAAEFDPSSYRQALFPALRGGEAGAQILAGDGNEFLQIQGDRNLFTQLDSMLVDGYDAPADLKRRILDTEQVSAQCLVGDGKLLLISSRIPGRDWILLTLDSMPAPPKLLDPVMVLYMASVVLLLAALLRLWLRRLREADLKRQADATIEACERLQASLDALTEANRNQMRFIDTISHNIRTPLNGIVGFTALAKRHIHEPERLLEYLGKVGDASAELLSKLNEGLDATGWHRYVEEEDQTVVPEQPIVLEGKRILMVEDNALNREIGEAVLSELGIVVECAVNGQEGFQKIAASRPGYYNLVLMDIQMPVMNGYEATEMIRRLRTKRLAEIPILAMSANVAEEDKRKAFEIGMDGYVEKPMNIEKLLTAIQSVLSRGMEI